MQLKSFALLVLQSALVAAGGVANAGPSFNSDRAGLVQASEAAGAELQRGFAQFHEMLRCLELHDQKCVDTARQGSLASFDKATGLFAEVAAKAPKQSLVMNPASDQEKEALESFRSLLQRREIPFPATERDLAEIAVKLVQQHSELLRKATFKGTKADYPTLRRVLSSQGAVLDIGILSSITWTISSPKIG
jgi:hypothetical protein